MAASLSKSAVVIGLLLSAGLPWFAGGRQPVALLITSTSLLLAGFLLWRSRPWQRLPWLLTAAGGGVVAWSLLSLIWSINRYQTVWFSLYLALAALVFIVTWQLRLDTRLRQLWKQGYVTAAAAFSLYGGWLYLTESYERLTSSFYWANPFAAWLLPALLIGWQLYRRSPSWWWLIAMAINLAAFALTDSRSAMLVAGLTAAAAVVRVSPSRREWTKLLLVLGLAAGLVVGLNTWRSQLQRQPVAVPGTRFSEALEGESQSGSDRLNFLRAGWSIWQQQPITGTGAGTFAAAHPAHQVRVTSAASHPHNFWAQVAAELGLIGVGLWLLLVAVWLRYSTRQDLAAWLATAALLVHFALDIDARYPALWLLLAALAGWSSGPRQRAPGRAWWLAILPLPLLVSVQLYSSEQQALRGQDHQDHSRYEEAAAAFAAARGGYIYDPDLLTKEGINHYALGLEQRSASELLEAGRLAQLAQAQDPRDSQHSFLLARIAQAQGDLVQAERHYQAAIAADRLNHPEYYLDFAQLRLRQQQPQAALVLLDEVIGLYPNQVVLNRSANSRLRVVLAQIYSLRGVLRGSLADAAQALWLDPDNRQAQQLKSQLSP